jgi:hypothetical protein
MDFTWVTTDDANAIQNSIVDAKGDLISATANDTPARLAVGANGETLVADSSTSTGLRYQVTQAAGTNKVLNSDFSIWQRGTSVAATLAAAGSGYTADRFQAYVDGTMAGTISRQTSGMDDFDYCARVQRTAGNTGLSRYYLAQPIETAQTQNLRGKTVTLSFWARKGANYSSASDALRVQIEYNTSANTNAFISPTGTVGQTTFTLTTSWQRFSLTATIGATYLSLAPQFSYAPSGTAGANDYYEISGIQLQAGSVATSFQTATGTIQGELSACQRYYYQVVTGAASSVGTGFGFGTTEIDICIPLKSTLRGIPTVVSTSGTGFYLARNSGTSININGAWIFGTNSDNNPLIYAAVTGATNGISYEVRSNSASSSIGLSAEL